MGSRSPHGSTVLAQVVPRSCPQAPLFCVIGIHHVAPSLALPASLLLPLPPSSNTILHTRPEEAFRFFGASWRAGSGRRRWTGSRLNIVTKKADTQPVLGTTEFFPLPHPYHLVSTRKILLAPVCPACSALPGYIHLVLEYPLCPSVDDEYASCDHRRPATHGESRPNRRRTCWSSRRGCRMSCRLRQSFRICRGPRRRDIPKTTHCHQHRLRPRYSAIQIDESTILYICR